MALFCALLSAATRRAARADVAMTGELTLSGRVLPVGGVRAKVLAAERAGIKRVIVPEESRADVPTDAAIAVTFVRELEDAIDVVFGEPEGIEARASGPAQPGPGKEGAHEPRRERAGDR